MTTPRVLQLTWYAVVNDLVGGWCVRTSQLPPSQAPGHPDHDGSVTVGEFLDERTAVYIATLHNVMVEQLRQLDADDAQARVEGPHLPDFTMIRFGVPVVRIESSGNLTVHLDVHGRIIGIARGAGPISPGELLKVLRNVIWPARGQADGQ